MFTSVLTLAFENYGSCATDGGTIYHELACTISILAFGILVIRIFSSHYPCATTGKHQLVGIRQEIEANHTKI